MPACRSVCRNAAGPPTTPRTPGTRLLRPTRQSNDPTEAINGRLEHLRGSAHGFRNLANYIARSLLETGGLQTPTTPSIVTSRISLEGGPAVCSRERDGRGQQLMGDPLLATVTVHEEAHSRPGARRRLPPVYRGQRRRSADPLYASRGPTEHQPTAALST